MKKYNIYPVLFALILISGLISSGCRNKEDDEEFRSFPESMEGAYIFTQAQFPEPVDLDGDGSGLPTSDALQCLYDMIDIYADCPSEEEVVFEFQYGVDSHYFRHYCGFTGQSRNLGSFIYTPGKKMQILLFEINDPGDLYRSNYIILDYDQCDRVDEYWIIKGEGWLDVAAYPERLTSFSYELKEVVLE